MNGDEGFWALIENARWFSGKSRGGSILDHRALGWYSNSPLVRSEIITVGYPDGSAERYHIPVVYLDEPHEHLIARTPEGYAHEATFHPAAMSAVLRSIAESRTGDGFICRGIEADTLPDGLIPIRYAGEQSNTSVFLGTSAMLKFFRKLEVGHNIDIELHAALAGSDAVAKLYGWIRGADSDLAMLVESLTDPKDGYVLACQKVGEDFAAEISALGVTLAEVHRKLAGVLGTTEISGDALANRFATHAAAVADGVEQLQPLLGSLVSRFDSLRGQVFPAQRVHGDFHLGQTLLTPCGWRIVDFEGEPMKSMAERAAMDSPWRDVAGLLRSIDYAAASAGDKNSESWRTETREAFLQAYCGAMGIGTSSALTAYELDKAVYEVHYEIRNRPHLLHVPLEFLVPTLKEN